MNQLELLKLLNELTEDSICEIDDSYNAESHRYTLEGWLVVLVDVWNAQPYEALARKALVKAAYDFGYTSLHNACYLGGFANVKKIVKLALEDERRRMNGFN